MTNKKLAIRGIIHALGVTVYIFLVSLVMNNGNRLFGEADNKFLSPIIFLLLFIFSALVTGSLVLGKPILLYLDGAKKEALKLFFYTSLSILVILLLAGATLAIVHLA